MLKRKEHFEILYYSCCFLKKANYTRAPYFDKSRSYVTENNTHDRKESFLRSYKYAHLVRYTYSGNTEFQYHVQKNP
jgi:hypothetical protein